MIDAGGRRLLGPDDAADPTGSVHDLIEAVRAHEPADPPAAAAEEEATGRFDLPVGS